VGGSPGPVARSCRGEGARREPGEGQEEAFPKVTFLLTYDLGVFFVGICVSFLSPAPVVLGGSLGVGVGGRSGRFSRCRWGRRCPGWPDSLIYSPPPPPLAALSGGTTSGPGAGGAPPWGSVRRGRGRGGAGRVTGKHRRAGGSRAARPPPRALRRRGRGLLGPVPVPSRPANSCSRRCYCCVLLWI